jgi:hypothetical protein
MKLNELKEIVRSKMSTTDIKKFGDMRRGDTWRAAYDSLENCGEEAETGIEEMEDAENFDSCFLLSLIHI